MVWCTAVMLLCLTNMLNVKDISFSYRASSDSSLSSFFFFSSFSFFFCLLQRRSSLQGTQASPTVHLQISLSPAALLHSLIFSSNQEASDVFSSQLWSFCRVYSVEYSMQHLRGYFRIIRSDYTAAPL